MWSGENYFQRCIQETKEQKWQKSHKAEERVQALVLPGIARRAVRRAGVCLRMSVCPPGPPGSRGGGSPGSRGPCTGRPPVAPLSSGSPGIAAGARPRPPGSPGSLAGRSAGSPAPAGRRPGSWGGSCPLGPCLGRGSQHGQWRGLAAGRGRGAAHGALLEGWRPGSRLFTPGIQNS